MSSASRGGGPDGALTSLNYPGGVATALYRRYRPESFAEVIGQDHVTEPLRRALSSGRVGHAYLFSGPRGCGKTTSARILARCLNCVEGPTPTPCGQCESCVELARGGSGALDVVEIDAASHGGVDDARELRERAAFAPVRDRYKVFIIDEAHMVTSAGFNALLKLVEEPPEHVKFIFATTEPDKVIGTIRSRTHHYPFRLIPPQILLPYLEEICRAENVAVADGVLSLAVRSGGGSARDTLSVLDQLIAGSDERGVELDVATNLLGFTNIELLNRAVDAIAGRDAAGLFTAIDEVIGSGHEPRRFVDDLLERFRDLIVLAAAPDQATELLPDVPLDQVERLSGQAQDFEPREMTECADIVSTALNSMVGATSPRLHLELLAAKLVLRSNPGASGDGGMTQQAPASGSARSSQGGRSGADVGGDGLTPRQRAMQAARQNVAAARERQQNEAPAAAAQAASDQPASAQSASGQAASAQPAPDQSAPDQQSTPQHQSEQQQPQQDQSQQPARAPQQESEPQPASHGEATQPFESQTAEPQTPEPQSRGAQSREPQAPDDAPAPSAPSNAPTDWATAALGEAPSQGQKPAASEAGSGPAAEPGPSEQPTPPAQSASGGSVQDVEQHWSAMMDALQTIRRPSWALIAQNAGVHSFDGAQLVLHFRSPGLVTAFYRGTAQTNMAQAVKMIMHVDVTVEATSGGELPPQGPSQGPRGQNAPGQQTPGQNASGQNASGQHSAGQNASGQGSPRQGTPQQNGQSSQAAPGSADGWATVAIPNSPSSAPQNSQQQAQSWGDAIAPRPSASPAPAATSPQGASAPTHNSAPAHSEPGNDGPQPHAAPESAQPLTPRQRAQQAAASGAPFAPEPDDDWHNQEPPEDPYGPGEYEPEPHAAQQAAPQQQAAPAQQAPVPAEPADAAEQGTSSDQAPVAVRGDVSAVALPAQPGEGEPRTHGQMELMGAMRRAYAGAGFEPADSLISAGSTVDSGQTSAPAEPAPAEPGPAVPAPQPDTQQLSGAALARKTFRESQHNHSTQRRGGYGSAPTPPPEPVDDDPFGGASLDDEDATGVGTRRRPGRDIVEEFLGGELLEVIDETKNEPGY